MKIARKELRRLVEASVAKRDGYSEPVEDPLTDPLDDLDYSDEQKGKIKMIAMADDEASQASADAIADLGGYEPTSRFGADTFSKHVQARELDIDLLNDSDLNRALDKAIDSWLYQNKDYITSYDDTYSDSFQEYFTDMVEQGDIDSIKNHLLFLVGILIHQTDKPPPFNRYLLDDFDQNKAKYEKILALLKRSKEKDDIPAVNEHIRDKIMRPLYQIWYDTKAEYEKEQGYDFSKPESVENYEKRIATFKEGKIKITRKQLRRLISEAITNINKGPLGQTPYRDPGAEIRSELSPTQLQKFDALKETEPATRDSIASALGFEGENFGDFEFDFKAKMAGQDPNERSYQTMRRTLELERAHHRDAAKTYDQSGHEHSLAYAHNQVATFISELLTQNLAPIPVLDAIFNKISQLQSEGAGTTVLHMFRSLMEYIARDAIRLNYIVDEDIARKYLGKEGSYPFDDYMKNFYKLNPDAEEKNPLDPGRKKRFK